MSKGHLFFLQYFRNKSAINYPFSPPDERAYHWYMKHKEKKEGYKALFLIQQ